jgi:hypothetical protein
MPGKSKTLATRQVTGAKPRAVCILGIPSARERVSHCLCGIVIAGIWAEPI